MLGANDSIVSSLELPLRAISPLDGNWRFRLDPKGLGELFATELSPPFESDARWMRSAYDDSGWDTIQVPSCWQDAGYQYNGVGWYRTAFERPAAAATPTRTFLHLMGVDYAADVWLNGRCLGSHEGYFGHFGFELTGLLRDENALVVRVDAPVDARGEHNEMWQLKTSFKGALDRCDTNDPGLVPGGIWNHVLLETAGASRIDTVSIRSWLNIESPRAAIDSAPATIAVDATISRLPTLPATVPARVRAEVFTAATHEPVCELDHDLPLHPGKQTASLSLELSDALLWWTWDLGSPALYDLVLTLSTDDGPADRTVHRFGVRHLERRDGWATYLNGERVFQRGANYMSDQLQSRMTAERYARDVSLLREANLNTVHPFCVVEREEFYRACDEAGLLVFQDFPVWMMMSPESGLTRRAIAQARELIDALDHHPSVAVWNFGSQPSIAQFEKTCSALATMAGSYDPTRIASQGNACFVHDPAVEYAHPTGSFFWPPDYGRQAARDFDWRFDTHQYQGWYYGEITDLAELPKEHLELITEFGAQGLPRAEALAAIIPPGDLFPPNPSAYARRCFQPQLNFARVDAGDTLEAFVLASQAYQAEIVRRHVEFYRRHKFRPCNGAHVFTFVDCWPAITWALVEYDRTPKAAYHALASAMAPIQAFLDPPVALAPSTSELILTPTVVNDTRRTIDRATITVTDRTCGAAARERPMHEQEITLEAMSITDLAPITWRPEPSVPVELHVVIASGDKRIAQNTYRLAIASSSGDAMPR